MPQKTILAALARRAALIGDVYHKVAVVQHLVPVVPIAVGASCCEHVADVRTIDESYGRAVNLGLLADLITSPSDRSAISEAFQALAQISDEGRRAGPSVPSYRAQVRSLSAFDRRCA
jgi:hypothetical protein